MAGAAAGVAPGSFDAAMAAAFATVAPTPATPTPVKPPAPVIRPAKSTPTVSMVVASRSKSVVVPARPPTSAFGTARIKTGKWDERVW
jgi:hypothetical protein